MSLDNWIAGKDHERRRIRRAIAPALRELRKAIGDGCEDERRQGDCPYCVARERIKAIDAATKVTRPARTKGKR